MLLSLPYIIVMDAVINNSSQKNGSVECLSGSASKKLGRSGHRQTHEIYAPTSHEGTPFTRLRRRTCPTVSELFHRISMTYSNWRVLHQVEHSATQRKYIRLHDRLVEPTLFIDSSTQRLNVNLSLRQQGKLRPRPMHGDDHLTYRTLSNECSTARKGRADTNVKRLRISDQPIHTSATTRQVNCDWMTFTVLSFLSISRKPRLL
jgi:hypothetical protein